MEERLVIFETARLAKEKGFGEDFKGTNYVQGFYFDEDCEIPKEIELQVEDGCRGDYFLRPTLSLLQKWLREVHGIYVESYHDLSSDGESTQYYTNWGFILPITLYQKQNGSYDEYNDWRVYEDALEYGLQEALKMIK